jgi:hypothetical protein
MNAPLTQAELKAIEEFAHELKDNKEYMDPKKEKQEIVNRVINALPPVFQHAVIRVSEALNTPPEWALLSLLSTTATAIGTGTYIKRGGYSRVYGNLYNLIVAEQGAAKSPIVRILTNALKNIQLKLIRDFHQQMKDSENTEEKPVKKQIILKNETQENIIYRMKNHPKGVLWSPDELSTVLDKTYSGKDIVSFLLNAFENEMESQGRATKDDIDIETTYLSLIYTTQPHTAKKKFLTEKNLSNGFCARHLITSAKELEPTLNKKELQEGELSQYELAIEFLYHTLTESNPVEVTFNSDVKNFLNVLDYQSQIQRKETLSSALKGFYGKRVDRVLKVALNLHMMNWANSQQSGTGSYNKHILSLKCVETARDIVDMTIEDFKELLEESDEDVQDKLLHYITTLVKKDGKFTNDENFVFITVRHLLDKVRHPFKINSGAELEQLLRQCPELGYLDLKQGKGKRKTSVFYLSQELKDEIFSLIPLNTSL